MADIDRVARLGLGGLSSRFDVCPFAAPHDQRAIAIGGLHLTIDHCKAGGSIGRHGHDKLRAADGAIRSRRLHIDLP